MEAINPIEPVLFEKWRKELNSDSLFAIAEASVYLGESGDPHAIEPLVSLAETTQDWLVQDFAIKALRQLAHRLHEVYTILKKIALIEPPQSDRVLEIRETNKSPGVYFDLVRGTLYIGGKWAEDEFTEIIFKSIYNELDLFNKIFPSKPLIASFYLKGMGISFEKELLSFFRKIQHQPNIIIIWYFDFYGDSRTLIGEGFESYTDMKFIYSEVPD